MEKFDKAGFPPRGFQYPKSLYSRRASALIDRYGFEKALKMIKGEDVTIEQQWEQDSFNERYKKLAPLGFTSADMNVYADKGWNKLPEWVRKLLRGE